MRESPQLLTKYFASGSATIQVYLSTFVTIRMIFQNYIIPLLFALTVHQISLLPLRFSLVYVFAEKCWWQIGDRSGIGLKKLVPVMFCDKILFSL